MSLTDRRCDTRLNLRIPLVFRPLTSPATPEQKAEALNVSTRGVFLVTDFPLKVGTPVEVSMTLPQELTGQPAKPVRCTARVVHVQAQTTFGERAGAGLLIERYEALAGERRKAS